MPVIRIIGLLNGEPTPFDGEYIKNYDPTPKVRFGQGSIQYYGGILHTSPDRREAKPFKDMIEATEFWRTQAPPPFDTRPDGKPNRPLTAFTVEIS